MPIPGRTIMSSVNYLKHIHCLSSVAHPTKSIVKRIQVNVRQCEFGKRSITRIRSIYHSISHRSQSIYNRLIGRRNRIEYDFIVTHCEINNRHGVGILLNKIFSDAQNILTIRSRNLYGGKQRFGNSHLGISHQGLSRDEVITHVQRSLGRSVPKRILSVPYYTDDVLSSIAIKKLFGVQLCTYIMDDQNIGVQNIPDDCMQELLQESDICFGISRELCDAYEKKFRVKFWFLPPVVQGRFIQQIVALPKADQLLDRKGILIGNIWSQQWLDRLRTLTKESNIKIDWYGNPNREWLSFQNHELQEDGITLKEYLPEEQLIKLLRATHYAVIPTGSSENVDDRPELTKYSLPSRLLFMAVSSHTPILVVGRKDSAAARFVEAAGIGITCDYDLASFRQSVEHLCSVRVQHDMRYRAALMAQSFSADGIAEWIWQSLEQKRPCDLRFERCGKDFDVIITLNETTLKHGTGALVKRIFGEVPGVFSIRSTNHYNGDHEFGDVSICLPRNGLTRSEAYQIVSAQLSATTVKRVFCVPYSTDELHIAIAIRDVFRVPLGTYIMDDQNICVNKIPDSLMREFLSKCSIRLTTHLELRQAYQDKYGLQFWLLPAIVPHHLLQLTPLSADDALWQSKSGALLGSLWSKKWYDSLCQTLINTGIRLDWYGNTQYYWMSDSYEAMLHKGITSYGVLPEYQLVDQLRMYPYVVVPTGMLDEQDDRVELSQLSLPGRIIFALAAANTPVILLGSDKTSAARFVKQFQIGLVSDYTTASFREAVDHITKLTIQNEMRQTMAGIAKEFSAEGITKWVWNSLALGEACDRKFEKLMSRPSERG